MNFLTKGCIAQVWLSPALGLKRLAAGLYKLAAV